MNTYSDYSIDQVLTGLRNTHSPAGLEQRIAERLAQAANAPNRPSPMSSVLANLQSLLASPARLAAAIAMTCAAIALLALLSHRPQTQHIEARLPSRPSTAMPIASTTTNTPVEQGGRLGSAAAFRIQPATSTPETATLDPNDPDAIALAETLAPSHPAPPMPLTPQEALLLRSTRPGQPIEVAELETRRESLLAEIENRRERASVREYIHGLLGPLASAEALTSPSPSDDTKPVAEPTDQPPSQ